MSRTKPLSESAVVQGELWGARSFDWASLQEHQHLPLYEAVLNRMDVGTGTRLFDAGCGSGLALDLALKRGAQVAGLDASAALVQIARKRIGELHVEHGDLEDLPYPEAAFTAVTSFNAVQYAGNPTRALAEMSRVAESGSLVSVATWGQPQDCEMRFVFEALRPLLPPPPPGKTPGGPFALSAPGALEGFLGDVGLEVHGREDVECVFDYPDEGTAWRALASSGPFVAAMRHSSEDAVRNAVLEAIRPYKTARGGVRIENTFTYVTANSFSGSHRP